MLFRMFKKHSLLYTGSGETKFFQMLPMIRDLYPTLADPESLADYVRCVVGIIRFGIPMDDAQLQYPGWDVAEPVKAAIAAHVGSAPGYRSIFRIAFDVLAEQNGKVGWLEKTPGHVFNAAEIFQTIPGARFIEIIRDPRDTLASKRARRQRAIQEARTQRKRWEIAYDPFWDSLSWRSFVRAGQRAAAEHPERYIQVRYESLVSAPSASLKDLCNFLDLPFEEQMLAVNKRNSAYSEEFTEGITLGSIRRWEQLPVGDLAVAQRILRREMDELEYPPARLNPLALGLIPLVLARSGFEFFLRLYRRFRLGGSSFLTTVISNYWKRWRKDRPAGIRRNISR
jgi:hypothetical protein